MSTAWITDIKAGDVVVVQRSNESTYLIWVQRTTKTQIITQVGTRYSRDAGRDLSSHYSRWSSRDYIIGRATEEQSKGHIASVLQERERIAKNAEMAALFVGLPVSWGPYAESGGWKVQLTFEHLGESEIRSLADKLKTALKESL